MKMLKCIPMIFILAALAVLTACNGGTEDDDGNIKIISAHNQTSPDSPYQVGLLKFKEIAEEESDGSIEVEVHAGTIGTEESELVEKLQLGAADVVLVSPGFMTQTGIKEVDLFSFPYLFSNYEHWEKAVDGEPGEKISELMNEKSNNSFKLLGYWSAGVRHYYGKKPIETIEDLKGMSIRTQTSGVVGDFWKKAGAIPSSISWGELYQGLQQDVVDSSENSYPYFVQENHHTTKNGKYVTETAHDYTTRFLLINGEKFDSYSKEHQEIILKAAEASVKAEREAVNKQEEEYKQKAIDDGAEVNEIDTEPFMEIAKPIQEAAAKDIGVEKLLQEIKDME